MPSGKKRKRHIATHKRKKRARAKHEEESSF
jgi:hypothetical protein